MTSPLTPGQILALKEMERKLLGERPRPAAVAVAADEDRRPPWLRGREGPRGLHGWLQSVSAKSTPVDHDTVAKAASPGPKTPDTPTRKRNLSRRDVEELIRLGRRMKPVPLSDEDLAGNLRISVDAVRSVAPETIWTGATLAFGALTDLGGEPVEPGCPCGRRRRCSG